MVMFWKNKEKIKQEKLEKLYEEVEDYVAYELPKYFPRIVRGVFDATGVGEAVVEAIALKVNKSGHPFPVKPYKFSKERKKDIVESGVAALERGQVKISWNKRLNQEMAGYKREVTESNNLIYNKTAGSDDYVDSLNLCLHNITLGIQVRVPAALLGVPKTLKNKLGENKAWQKKKIHQPKKMLNSSRRRL